MQSQQMIKGESKGELLFEIQGKTVARAIRDITPHGIKFETTSQGQVSGKVNANFLLTGTAFWNTDGTIEWENKGIGQTLDGDMYVTNSRGTGRATGPTTARLEGDAHFMTQSPKLQWLNDTHGSVEVSADRATETFTAKIYAKK